MVSRETELLLDHEKAQRYGEEYWAKVQNEFFGRSQMLNLALDGFSDWLALPEKQSKAGAIWDAVFNTLSLAVPALRLGKFITQLNQNASVAVGIANAAEVSAKAAKTVKAASGAVLKGAEIAKKIDEIKDKGGKVVEGTTKVTEADPVQAKRTALSQKMEASYTVTRLLLQDANQALAAWNKIMNQELFNLEFRLKIWDYTKQSQLEFVKANLVQPEFLSDEELVQLRTQFLYLLTQAYCKQNVKIVETTTVTVFHRAMSDEMRTSGPAFSIDGLNNAQQEQLEDWFGASAKRGKYFTMAPIVNAMHFLRIAGSQVEKKTEYRHVYSTGMKI